MYITSQLSHKETAKKRMLTAHRVTRAILPFDEKHKRNWQLLKNLCTADIIPIMTYGVKHAATTKAIRRSIRRAELKVLYNC